jgi:hypothetical protein
MYIAAISSGPGHSPRSRRLLRFALIMTPRPFMDLRQLRGDGSKQLRQLVPGTAHFLLGRTFRRLYAAIVGKTKKGAWCSSSCPPGTSGRSSAIPERPSAPGGAEGLGTARFS